MGSIKYIKGKGIIKPNHLKIKSCSSQFFWYNDKVGKKYEIIDEDKTVYIVRYVPDDGKTRGLVEKCDCELITD